MSSYPIWFPSMKRKFGHVKKTPGVYVPGGKTMWGHSTKAAVCKQRRETSEEIKSADTQTLDFQPPKLWEINCGLSHPVYSFLLQQPELTQKWILLEWTYSFSRHHRASRWGDEEGGPYLKMGNFIFRLYIFYLYIVYFSVALFYKEENFNIYFIEYYKSLKSLIIN